MTEAKIRKNPLCIISLATFGDHAMHDIQANTGWTKNPYDKDYVVVPDDMVESIMATQGYCDITLNKEKTEVVSFVVREIPKSPAPEQPVDKIDQLRADIEYLAIMTGVEL